MYQRECRLTRASKCFGSSLGLSSPGIPGGSTEIDMRKFSEEKPALKSAEALRLNQLKSYIGQSPLMKAAQAGALNFWSQLPGLTSQVANVIPSLKTAYNITGQTIANQGRLTPGLLRDAQQQSLSLSAGAGMANSNQGIANALLNTEAQRQARYNTAVGQQQGIAGSISGLVGAEQGLQTGGLNQLVGTQNAAVNQYGLVSAPAWDYIGNLFGGNLAASGQQAGLNQQGNIANAQLQQAAFQNWINSMASIVGGVGLSDERLKRNIRDTGLRKDDVPVKVWEYATRPGIKFLGFTAQDVERKDPTSVRTDPLSGIKSVGWKWFPIQLTPEGA